jgi:alpha-amylase
MTPKVLLQAFYKRGKYVALPCPADPKDGPATDWWWDHLTKQARALAQAGFTTLWLPPVFKAEQGIGEAALGYSVFDDYDIGWKNQKGAVHTRYGNREQLTRCAATLRANGLEIYLDLQLNHRKGGSGADGMTFEYLDAFGNPAGGRFTKNAQCFHSRYPAGQVPAGFHPEIPQDPNVPDGIWELQEGSNVYFGPDLAPINGKPPGYVLNGLIDSVNWLSRALDVQGYRLDHVQGISTNFFLDLLNQGPLAGKFAVGEYWNGSVPQVNGWATSAQWMQGRSGVLDFPLYFTLLAMSNDPSFDMASLDHAGVAGVNPFHAVTFVENHDTESRRDLVPKNIQPEDKPLAYAYILTSEGFPCVFYKDYSTDPECLGARLQPVLDNLIWIHQNIAEGSTQQRWKDGGVFVFERLGGAHLLVALNKDKTAGRTIHNIATGFAPNTRLHDYTGHAEDIDTDGSGHVALNIPRNLNGLGYVCYSLPGIAGGFATTPSAVTQVFEGARDLDIKPADTQAAVRVFRIWVAAGTSIQASLTFDAAAWSPAAGIVLTLDDASGTQLATKVWDAASSGQSLMANAAAEGWYVFNIRAQNTPASNPPPAYKLTVNYMAPQVSAALGI